MRTAKITRTRLAAAAVAAGLVAAGTVGLAQSSQAATATYTVAPKSGPGGTNAGGQPASLAKVITINGAALAFKTGAGTVKVGTVTWIASGTACAQGSNSLSGFTVPTSNQIVVTVPLNTLALTATTVGSTTTYSKKDYNICVFDTAGTPVLLGSGKYTVYPTPTITAAVSPTKGATSGGGTIAVDGTGFTATSVVKVGGNVATQVKVATDGKSLTAKVPAGTAGATVVTVTTEGGTSPATSGGGAAWDDYTYVNAISVSPESGLGAADVLTVSGVGFNALDFTLATTKIYLAPGSYDATSLSTELCGSVQVISDTQLVCKTDAGQVDGAYTVVVVGDNTDATTSAATASATSASSTYTVADF
jgi:hypothetical protein